MNTREKNVPQIPENLWRRDALLCQAAELVDRMGGRLRAVSFDFFDTLVWRLVDRPCDVFTEAGQRLERRNAFRPGICGADFETLRCQAEMKAREKQSVGNPAREDISLKDIYENLKLVAPDMDAAAQVERAVECEVCQINPGVADFIREMRGRGLRVVILSDIYLSAAHLKEILAVNHFDASIFEFVLTSSDTGVCKGTGRLFDLALKQLKLEAAQLLHIGDNYRADVIGARRAGVRAAHYAAGGAEAGAILERERILLGAQTPVFSANSLRVMAARYFGGETPEDFFARSGAMLMGPIMSRFASWACGQFLSSGIRKIGAFMREGDLFAPMLQREADAQGYDLETRPLFVNRKSTALAALGPLTADGIVSWLEYRTTLSIRRILEDLGLSAQDIQRAPFAVEERADTREKILKLAKHIFRPEIAGRIEANSAEERRKVMDYLRPWIAEDNALGVCDLGYNGSAQMQLMRIFELESSGTRMVGCYLATHVKAAERMLKGLDVRHFLGAFCKPDIYFRSFIRSPAFLEQCMTAPLGTTLGYERQPDGSVTPLTDRIPFNDEMLRCQKAFKDGAMMYQTLWLSLRAAKPGLLDGQSEFSRRVLAELDSGAKPLLARATAFPLPCEIQHFGSLPLDDYFYADSKKTMCSEKNRVLLREHGYGRILGASDVYWPQATHAQENPRANSDFFSYAKALLYCNTERDGDGVRPDVTVFVRASSNPGALRECLRRLADVENPNLVIEAVIGMPKNAKPLRAVAREFAGPESRIKARAVECEGPLAPYLNQAADASAAPFVLFLEEETRLMPGWDAAQMGALKGLPEIAALLPWCSSPDASAACPLLHCLLLRRHDFVSALGFEEGLGPEAAAVCLLLRLQELGRKAARSPNFTAPREATVARPFLAPQEKTFLRNRWGDFEKFAGAIPQAPKPDKTIAHKVNILPAADGLTGGKPVAVAWEGTFLDLGSLSHVNRQLTTCLAAQPGMELCRVGEGALAGGASASAEFQDLARTLRPASGKETQVTIRHQWPPNWNRPNRGALVVIQPWEYGALPKAWVAASGNVDEFWVPSNYVRRVYVESGVAEWKVFVVPNGVDADRYREGLEPMELATKKKFRFLFVGGTIHRKGPDLLLEAYLRSFTAEDDVCLVIKDFGGRSFYAGQTFETQIKAAQSRPGAPEILYLSDELSAGAMPGLYAACDCLAHPYRGEGFGLPVLEAMACGLPVIVTGGGATDDFATEERAYRIAARRKSIGLEIGGLKLAREGWLLEPDLPALAAKMKWLAGHAEEARHKGRAAGEYVRQEWTWQRAAQIARSRLEELQARKPAEAESPARPIAAKPVVLTLPETAKIGHLGEARDLLGRKKYVPAWQSALAALARRPFHCEAWLLLAEIARAAGDMKQARWCAGRAKELAPEWRTVKQFLKNLPARAGVSMTWPAPPETPAAPRLTVCLITKNEERFLAQCLQSIQGLAHQIVVVDTGSADGTVGIAKKFGAEVHHFAWCDDFAAARNAALEHATGDWVLSLDADEELLAEHRETILEEMRADGVMGYRLPIINKGREQEGRSYVPRLFRNAPGLFYVGRVHEQVFSSIEVRCRQWGLQQKLGGSVLFHHGYVKEVMEGRDKIARNLRLLERAIGELPGEPNLVMNLGLELIRSGQFDAGLEKYREAFQLMAEQPPGEVVPELRETLLTQLTTHLLAIREFAEAAELWEKPFAKSGGMTASNHFGLGLAYMELNRPADAAEQMRQCLAKRGQPAMSPVNVDILKAAPNHCLALCLCALGRTEAAAEAFAAALADEPSSLRAGIDFARFQAGQGRPLEALKLLNSLAAEHPGEPSVWKLGGEISLSRPEFLEFARDWTGEAAKQLPEHRGLMSQRAEALLLTGDTEGALPLWRRAESPHPGRQAAAVVLCELLTGGCRRHFPAAEETAVSRELVKWYRQLIAAGAHSTVRQLDGRMEEARAVAPGFVGVWEAATQKARGAMVAA